MPSRRTDSQPLEPLSSRADLLLELSEFLVRLEDLSEVARRTVHLSSVELPLRRLSDDLFARAHVASVHVSGKMTHAYSLAMQEAADCLNHARQESHLEQWLEYAEQTREALQRAVVRVRRLED